jgi:hypothetical protein
VPSLPISRQSPHWPIMLVIGHSERVQGRLDNSPSVTNSAGGPERQSCRNRSGNDMIKKIPLSQFKNREFYYNYSWSFFCSGSKNMTAIKEEADRLGEMTQVLSILNYFDVEDSLLRERAERYIDGSWTDETKEIARFTDLPLQTIVNAPYYAELSPDWRCPGCSRSKMDTVRRSNSGKWTIRFTWHHDHMGDGNWPANGAYRFDGVIVCEDCNNLDNAVKVAISPYVKSAVGVPSKGVFAQFSFSTAELAEIFPSRGKRRLEKVSKANIHTAVEIYNNHLSNGLDGFVQNVKAEHQKILRSVRKPDPWKLPFLKRWAVTEKAADVVAGCIVDGLPIVGKSLMSQGRGNGRHVQVFMESSAPIPSFIIDSHRRQYVKTMGRTS